MDNDNTAVTTTSKRSSWRWWQSNNNNKTPKINIDNTLIDNNNNDCASSIAPSSLLVQHSIHSKESEDILSTASIKSKPWVSKKLKSANICPTQDEEQQEDIASPTSAATNSSDIKYNQTPSSSLLNNVPSITSSTMPVINSDMNNNRTSPLRRKSFDATLFSGIKAKFGKWVGNNKNNHSNSSFSSIEK